MKPTRSEGRDGIAGGRRRLGRCAAAAAAVVALGVGLTGPVPAAFAAAGVSVTSSLGSGKADAEYSTSIHVSGSGFQSISGGMGGIYVLFGWVDDGSWRPSDGGVVGADYLYVPDSEAKDNQGFQRFVAFPGSETEAAAQAVMGADGSWSVDMTIPGPTFQSQDRSGSATSVDCLSVQCGVITIGAHGIKNPSNETFTPIEFVSPAGGASPGELAVDSAGAVDAAAAAAPRQLSLGVDGAMAAAGNALPFTARGFAVGEQVVASLDGGVVAVGPLTAGNAGEVAGVIPLPADLAAGTHLLRVQGAATEGSVETEITVAANPLAQAAQSSQSATPAWVLILMAIAIVLAFALVVTNVLVALVRARRRRRARSADAAIPAPEEAADASARPSSSPAASVARPDPVIGPDEGTVEIPIGASA